MNTPQSLSLVLSPFVASLNSMLNEPWQGDLRRLPRRVSPHRLCPPPHGLSEPPLHSVPCRLGFGRQGDDFARQPAFEGEFGAALRAVGEMRLDAGLFGLAKGAGDVPGEEQKRLPMGVAVHGNDVVHEPPHSQSASCPASLDFRCRRAWNMRVFTVSTGQSMISAISR